MRKKMPDAPRGFRTPMVPLIPILGIGTCLFMMVFLPFDTWIRLIAWMIVGLDVYLFYGLRNSHFRGGSITGHDYRVVAVTGLVMAVMLAVIANLHHMNMPDDIPLFVFSMVMSVAHLFIYAYFYFKKPVNN
jgi:APA family basic amino acid/polyamine antiporter